VSAPEKLHGDIAVGLSDVKVDLKVKVKTWGAVCKLSSMGSSVTIIFHDDGGVELEEAVEENTVDSS
jgi:hypothetical protein